MANDSDNLVLRMLREIRAKQDEHSAKFEHIDTRFDRTDARLDTMSKDLEEVRFQVTYGLGVASINHLKAREFEQHMTTVDKRLRRLEEKAGLE